MRTRHLGSSLATAALCLALFAGDARAYVDPGTGSLILQLLAAGLVTATVVFRKSIGRVLLFLRRAKK